MKVKGKHNFEITPQSNGTDVSLEGHSHTESDVTDLDKYTQAEVDAAIASASGTTDHTELSNIGTNTHAQIDTHIADNDIHGAGSGDVSSSANITDNRIVRGDGGAKGVQESDWTIADNGRMSVSTEVTGTGDDHFLVKMHNTATISGGGLLIQAGESEGDISFRIEDENKSFLILDVHSDNGQFVFGDSYDNVKTNNSAVYGVDVQHDSGDAMDFNTQNGVYRIGGKATVMMTEFQDASSDSESSTTSSTYQQKVRLTTGSLPSGSYYIQWSYEIDGQGNKAHSRVQINDSEEINYNLYDSSINGYIAVSGFIVKSSFSGVKNIDIDWRSDDNIDTILIRRARLVIWRIS